MLSVCSCITGGFDLVSKLHPFSVRVTVVIISSAEVLVYLDKEIVMVHTTLHYSLLYWCYICCKNADEMNSRIKSCRTSLCLKKLQ
jgi:hypothetical protein